MTEKFKQECLDILKKIIFKYIDLEKTDVFIFGSFARGDFSRSSDIDVGFLGNDKVDKAIIYKILDEVEESIIPNRVDIVDFFDLKDEEFKNTALKDVISWNKAKNLS